MRKTVILAALLAVFASTTAANATGRSNNWNDNDNSNQNTNINNPTATANGGHGGQGGQGGRGGDGGTGVGVSDADAKAKATLKSDVNIKDSSKTKTTVTSVTTPAIQSTAPCRIGVAAGAGFAGTGGSIGYGLRDVVCSGLEIVRVGMQSSDPDMMARGEALFHKIAQDFENEHYPNPPKATVVIGSSVTTNERGEAVPDWCVGRDEFAMSSADKRACRKI